MPTVLPTPSPLETHIEDALKPFDDLQVPGMDHINQTMETQDARQDASKPSNFEQGSASHVFVLHVIGVASPGLRHSWRHFCGRPVCLVSGRSAHSKTLRKIPHHLRIISAVVPRFSCCFHTYVLQTASLRDYIDEVSHPLAESDHPESLSPPRRSPSPSTQPVVARDD